MTDTPPTNNKITVVVKTFDKHMVIADYSITLESNSDSISTLIEKIPEVRKSVEI